MIGRRKRLLIFFVAFILLVLYGYRLYMVNEPYKKYTTKEYAVGETFTECSLNFTIEGWQQISSNEFTSLYGEFTPEYKNYYDGMEETFFLIAFTVENPTAEDLNYDRMMIELHGKTWSTQGGSRFEQNLRRGGDDDYDSRRRNSALCICLSTAVNYLQRALGRCACTR